MAYILSWFMNEAHAERLVTASYFVLTGCIFVFLALIVLLL
jgi:hypothetical protein